MLKAWADLNHEIEAYDAEQEAILADELGIDPLIIFAKRLDQETQIFFEDDDGFFYEDDELSHTAFVYEHELIQMEETQ